jgi:hypothetical protein
MNYLAGGWEALARFGSALCCSLKASAPFTHSLKANGSAGVLGLEDEERKGFLHCACFARSGRNDGGEKIMNYLA